MTNMTMDEALALFLPDEGREAESLEALYALLEERIRRYTMGDSTSVPIDTAQRLLESIVYCADLNRRFPAQDAKKDAPFKARWQEGVCKAKRIQKRARLLLMQAQRTPPPLVNIGYCDTLNALPAFFTAYDADFFAKEIPCSFDYPLCYAVEDTLFGAEFMQEYLRRLLAENTFLRAFSEEALRALYANYYIDYADLLVNLYLPAAEMATLCALAGEPVRQLALSQSALLRVDERLTRATPEEAQRLMRDAADRALQELQLGGELLRKYMYKTALDLLVRLRAISQSFASV